MKKCENCEHSVQAKNDKVVGCKILNVPDEYDSIPKQKIIKGNIYEGW